RPQPSPVLEELRQEREGSSLKWTPIFGPGVKVVRGACSRTERSRTNEEYTQEVLTGIQGEGGARGVAGRRDGAGAGEAVQRAPEPDPRMEARVLRERAASVLAWRAVGNERQQRARGPAAEEDRRADGG